VTAPSDDPEFSWRELGVAAYAALEDLSRRATVALSGALQNADTWLEELRPVLEGVGRAALEIRDAYDEGVPSDWQRLTVPQMFAVISLMEETGWCLTTSPPVDTLRAILDADDLATKGALLLAAEAQILDDLDLELRAIDQHQLPIFADAACQAWEAQASGLFVASQALSAALLSALSHGRGPLPLKSLGAARVRFEQLDIEEAGAREIRFIAVAQAVGAALKNFPPDDPTPGLFNRHAAAHGLTTDQYNRLNSLTALMLSCGWLRELLWLMRIAEEERT
jgi:hypothetical protein